MLSLFLLLLLLLVALFAAVFLANILVSENRPVCGSHYTKVIDSIQKILFSIIKM